VTGYDFCVNTTSWDGYDHTLSSLQDCEAICGAFTLLQRNKARSARSGRFWVFYSKLLLIWLRHQRVQEHGNALLDFRQTSLKVFDLIRLRTAMQHELQ